jgi:subtilisin-like proprotein convertase family protein
MQIMKNTKITIAILAFVFIASSCSKSDSTQVAPTLSPEISFENTTPTILNDASGSGGNTIWGETISTINVPATGIITDNTKFTLEMNVGHNYSNQLGFTLIAPDLTEYEFVRLVGQVGSKYNGANKLRFCYAFNTFVPNSNTYIPAGNYTATASNSFYNLQPPLSKVFYVQGKSISGFWKLKIIDGVPSNNGSLSSWKIIFGEGALK